jgi:uncharacterized protein YebE (UPF0316 family)
MLPLSAFARIRPNWLRQKRAWVALVVAGGLIALAGVLSATMAGRGGLAHLIPWTSLTGALLIFGLRLTDVPIGTVKTVMMVRGMRGWATALGFVEVSIWVLAIGRVMGQLNNPWNVLGYAAGYSAGTWLGMWLESRLAFGNVEVHTISLTKNEEIAATIRDTGYGVTQFQAYGQSGPVCIVGVIAQRKHLELLLRRIRAVDAGAFVTVDDTRQVVGGHQMGR